MQRYFVNEIIDNKFYLSLEDRHHIVNVMRMKVGEEIEIVCQRKLFIAKIITLGKEVVTEIISEEVIKENKKPTVIIAQAILKEQKMDYILQKTTEIGIDTIIPITTERTLIKPDKKEDTKIARWQRIVKEASEQSKRLTIPTIDKIANLDYLISLKFDKKYICSVNEKNKTIKSILQKVDINDTILFVIGPEGGFSEKEEEKLLKNGFLAISLGNNVLRSETASSFILSVIEYEFTR